MSPPSAARRCLRRAVRATAAGTAVAGFLHSGPGASAQVTGFAGFGPVNTIGTPAGGINSSGTTFQLTNAGNQAASAFFPIAQRVGGVWSAEFTYATQDGADGFTFAVHNDARGGAAIGAPGGALGYVGDAASGYTAVAPSAAYAVNIYNADTTGVRTGGATGAMSATGVTPFSTATTAQPIQFRLSYVPGYLTATILNPNNAPGLNPSYGIRTDALNVAAALNAATGLVGFTGASGGVASNQTIGAFRFRSSDVAAYTPVGVSGFNADPVVDVGSTAAASTNATIDAGFMHTGDTFYARGQNPALPTRGLPMGATFASANDTSHTFALADANANNALLLSKTETRTLTLTTPKALGGLSILSATGNGTGTYAMTVHFANGATETITGAVAPDWFNAGGFALSGLGRVNQSDVYSEGTTTNPRLYQQDFLLDDTTDKIVSIDFLQVTGSSTGANVFIFGVSGLDVTPVPEPAACLAAAAGLLTAARLGRHWIAGRPA